MHNSESLSLHFGLSFDDLYRREGLVRLDAAFVDYLDNALAARLKAARAEFSARKQQSELMVDLAPHVEDFIGDLFGISAEVRALQATHDALAPVYALKRKFIQRKAISGVTAEQASAINGRARGCELETLFNEPLTEASFVEQVSRWLENETTHAAELGVAAQYASWAADEGGRQKHHRGGNFKSRTSWT